MKTTLKRKLSMLR